MRYEPDHCYLGPASWPQWILRLAPYWRVFNRSAYVHDKFFKEGGGMREFLRANRIFKMMVRSYSKTECHRFFGKIYVFLVECFSHWFFRFESVYGARKKNIIGKTR